MGRGESGVGRYRPLEAVGGQFQSGQRVVIQVDLALQVEFVGCDVGSWGRHFA